MNNMKLGKLRLILLAFSLVFVSGSAFAQDDILVNISYAPQEDSVFFAKCRARMAEIRKKRPTVAVVLAGGGAKGASHIGVLEYLEEKGIPVDLVAGTSMGGLMGGMYAMGYSAKEIDSIVKTIDWNVMMSDKIPNDYYSYERKKYKGTYIMDVPFVGKEFVRSLPSGFLYGLNVYNMLSNISVGYQHDMDFMDMPTPFCCVATEIVTQTEKRWAKGSLIDAMRSTMSIPGYFRPVRVDSMILSDGGTKNNFPTDVAKAAGADIIIGVELSMPKDYKGLNNIADILMQTARYSGGGEAHNRNVKNATVYITPDISGFGMMSFGTEEISTLIDRGYEAAALHERELDSIVRVVGNGGRQLHNGKAINISNQKVKITSIVYEGVTDEEKRYIDDIMPLDVGKEYGKENFEEAVSAIYGTMAFSHVTYRLIGEGDGGYQLLYRCEKRPVHSIGFGLRADTEEWLAAIFNVGFWKNTIFGHEVNATLRLSMSPYLKLDWTYRPIVGPRVGASLKTQFRTIHGSEARALTSRYYEQSWRNELCLYVADKHWNLVDLSMGIRLENTPFYRLYSETAFLEEHSWRTYPYLYLHFVYDRKDNMYFPTRGFRGSLTYDYTLINTHFVSASVSGVIPVCKFFTILGSVNGRYILGRPNKNVYMDNYVGGAMNGRYYDHQIAFFGINGEKTCDELVTTADLDFRFKVYKKCYVSLLVAAMHDGASLKYMNKPIYAAGVKFSYESKFGPLALNVHANSTKKAGIYLSAGYDF